MPTHSPAPRKRRTARLDLERLEARDVPATGILQGTLWNDLNGNGARDTGEPGLVGRTVFIDANTNGAFDTGELSQTTGADGSYSFTGLAAGTYTVAEVVPSGWVQTNPSNGTPTPTAATSAVWQPLNLFGGDVQEVAFSPTTSGLVLAALNNQTYHGGLYRSGDGGATWTRLPAFDKDEGVLAVAFGADGAAYAGTYQGVFKSTDGGVSWTKLPLDGGGTVIVSAIGTHPTDGNTLLVGQGSSSATRTLYRSTDGGATWTSVSPSGTLTPEVNAIAFDPSNPLKVYAGYGNALGGGGQVWFSADGGKNWANRSTATSGLPNAPIEDFAFDGSGGVLVAGGARFGSYYLGLYRSANDGQTWTSLSSAWPMKVALSVAVSGSTIAAGTDNDGVYVSTDGGASWTYGASGTAGMQVNAVEFGPGATPTLYAGASAFGVLASTDGGTSFAASSEGMREFAVGAVAVNPLDSNELAITSDSTIGTVLTSTDAGATWTVEPLGGTTWETVTFAPDGSLYAIGHGVSQTQPEGLYRRNGDGTWTSIGPGTNAAYWENDIQVIAFDPSDANVIFAAGESFWDPVQSNQLRAVVWRTTDAGATWTRVYLGASNTSVQDLEVIGTGSTAVVLASLYDGYATEPTNGGVARSADGGATWSLSNTGLPAAVQGAALAASRQNDGRVYLASSSYYKGYGLFRSDDYGQSWAQVGGTSLYPIDILVDPTDDWFLYSSPGGRSTDGGDTWGVFAGGLDDVSSFYADFHMAYAGGDVPRLYLNTWEGLYTTGIYSSARPARTVVLADGATVSGLDFGTLVLPGQISGSVWEDENADGVWGGEFGRGGWVVYLDADNDGVLDPGEKAVRSYADGSYRMTGVAPGTYTVRVQMQPKYHQTYPTGGAGYAVTVNPDGAVTGKNFGIQSDPTELRGTLWSDDDGDGVKDAGEAPLVGWRVYLDENANGKYDGERSATTDANGNYVITGFVPGAYIVAQEKPPFYQQTTPGDGKSVYDAVLGVPDVAGELVWSDHDTSTPDVIDIWYDFRPYNGYANQITDAQKAAARAAMTTWEQATGGKIKFAQNTAAGAADIINVGTGDLRAVGYTSGLAGVLAAGGSWGTTSLGNGVVWMDVGDTWDTTIGNGETPWVYDYFTVAGHELGHALGLMEHFENVPWTWHTLMAPFYPGELTAWSAVDRDRVRGLYGASEQNGLGFYAVNVARGDIRTGLDFGNKPVPIPFDNLALDFGPSGSPVAGGYTGASSATTYDPINGGYGWVRSYNITDVDRGAVSGTTDLTRDFTGMASGGFAVDLPNGEYDVTLTFGDAAQKCDNVAVYLERAYKETVTANAGQFLTRTYRVTVADRQLLIELADAGGFNSQVALNALTITRVQPSLTVSVSPTSFSEGAGTNAATGTVTRGGDFSQALTVTLSSGDTTEATVPQTVTIVAGQASANFTISAVDDTILDGTQTVTITASASGYNAGSRQVSVTDNESPPPPPPPAAYDFGTATSQVASGYTRVSEGTTYTAARGYGWLSGTIGSTDRGAAKQATDLTRDFNYTANGTFVVDVPNGTYTVTITLGDALAARDKMGLYLEGQLVGSNISTASGKFVVKTYSVTVSDGQLTLTLTDAGGKDPNAVINALTITRTGGMHALAVSEEDVPPAAPAPTFAPPGLALAPAAPTSEAPTAAPAPSAVSAPPFSPTPASGAADLDALTGGVFVGTQLPPSNAPRPEYLFDAGDDLLGVWVGNRKK